jgi:hypothetical protein
MFEQPSDDWDQQGSKFMLIRAIVQMGPSFILEGAAVRGCGNHRLASWMGLPALTVRLLDGR